jgi:hypothetical protein
MQSRASGIRLYELDGGRKQSKIFALLAVTKADHSSSLSKKTAVRLNYDSVWIEIRNEESSIDRLSGHFRRQRIEASSRQ